MKLSAVFLWCLACASASGEYSFKLRKDLSELESANILHVDVTTKGLTDFRTILDIIDSSLRKVFDDTEQEITTTTTEKYPTEDSTGTVRTSTEDTGNSTKLTTEGEVETSTANQGNTTTTTTEEEVETSTTNQDNTTTTTTEGEVETSTANQDNTTTTTTEGEVETSITDEEKTLSVAVNGNIQTRVEATRRRRRSLRRLLSETESFRTIFVINEEKEKASIKVSEGLNVVALKNGEPVPVASLKEKVKDFEAAVVEAAHERGVEVVIIVAVDNKSPFPVWGYILIVIGVVLLLGAVAFGTSRLMRKYNHGESESRLLD